MKTLKEALFSRRNIEKSKIYTLSDLEDKYEIVILEYLTRRKNPAFMIFDTFHNRCMFMVNNATNINSWWFDDDHYRTLFSYLRNLFDKSTISDMFYCPINPDEKLYDELRKIMIDNNGLIYDPYKLRLEIEDKIKPFDIIVPEMEEFK